MYVDMYGCICIYIYVYIYICIDTYMYIYIYAVFITRRHFTQYWFPP